MEAKLNEIIKIRLLQDNVVILRKEIPDYYVTFAQRECDHLVKSLVTGKVISNAIEVPKLEPIKLEYKTALNLSTTDINDKANKLMKCLELMKKY